MSSKLVKKKEKLTAIARAALRLFGQKGYAATSVGQIAGEAGVGKGTLYAYFDTKQDIFVAAMMQWMTELNDTADRELAAIADPVQRLRALAAITADIFDPHIPTAARLFFEVMQQTVLQDGAFFERRHMIAEMSAGRRQRVVAILLEGVAQGMFRPEIARDVDKIATNLMAFLDGIGWNAMISNDAVDLRSQVSHFLDIFLGAIRTAGDATRTPAAVRTPPH